MELNKAIMKYIIILIVIAVGIFGCAWLFNHINPWVGILGGVILALIVGKLSVDTINKLNKKDE